LFGGFERSFFKSQKITTAVNAQSDRTMSEDEFLQMQKRNMAMLLANPSKQDEAISWSMK
jgi:hypothetical protein